MSLVTKTYQWQGPIVPEVQNELGPSAKVAIRCLVFSQLIYDDSVADAAAADEVMARSGFVPYVPGGASVNPSLALFSPSLAAFDLQVSDLGVLTTSKLP